jgi:hypothetical protein
MGGPDSSSSKVTVKKRDRPQVERISNLTLIDDGVRVIEFQLSQKRPSYFRIARECHLLLLRSMVEALRGSANLAILGRPKDKTRTVTYRVATEPWKEIHKEIVPTCTHAWRYSAPTPAFAPPAAGPTAPPAEEDHLLGFYDLLARIQADCFMCHVFGACAATISDRELRDLEWLHEQVRNEFEHYVPRGYTVGVPALLNASLIALHWSRWLLYSSGSAFLYEPPRGLQARLATMHAKAGRVLAGFADA